MTNRTAFVTGASRGIGRAMRAERCAGAGFARGILARETGDARRSWRRRSAPAGRRSHRGGPRPHVARNRSSEAFAKAVKEFGRIDILVNNAGITKDGLAMRMKKDDWDAGAGDQPHRRVSGDSAGAARHDARALGPHHQHLVRGGRDRATPARPTTSASKAGLIGLTKSLAQEMASRNITVNAVAPGFIETDMTARALRRR